MTRLDCVKWLQQHSLDVPNKSACVFCPFHKRAEWRQLKQQGGSDWDHAMNVDQEIRKKRDTMDIFIHPSRLPLEEAVRIPEDVGGAPAIGAGPTLRRGRVLRLGTVDIQPG